MTVRIPAPLALAAFFAAALAAGFAFGRAHAAPAAPPTDFRLLADGQGTQIFLMRYDNHDCFVASAKGASGISINCPH